MPTYKYILEPYLPGGSTKTTCPNCHRKHCFTHYIDALTRERLHPSCGICDHKHSCSYHYPPSAYFHDHPSTLPSLSPSPSPSASPRSCGSQRSCASHRSCGFSRSSSSSLASPRSCGVRHSSSVSPSTLDSSLLSLSHHPTSTFYLWLLTILPPAPLLASFHAYHLGATHDGGVIFWQIDIHNRVRTGHIMHYGTDGHRTGTQNWTHAILKQRRQLPPQWTLSQCFFGEHLLPLRPEATVCLVESEKTAFICSVLYPEYIWLATCSCSGLNAQKATVLQGRRVIIYPDSGELTKWRAIMLTTQGIRYSFVEDLERYLPNTDLIDLLFHEAQLKD